jgi:Ca2+-binding EF-hand superfamily protein
MSKLTLTPKEIKKLYEMFNTLHETEDYGTIELNELDDSTITATFSVTHREVEGEFTVILSEGEF